jgi:hypothetical protein
VASELFENLRELRRSELSRKRQGPRLHGLRAACVTWPSFQPSFQLRRERDADSAPNSPARCSSHALKPAMSAGVATPPMTPPRDHTTPRADAAPPAAPNTLIVDATGTFEVSICETGSGAVSLYLLCSNH